MGRASFRTPLPRDWKISAAIASVFRSIRRSDFAIPPLERLGLRAPFSGGGRFYGGGRVKIKCN